MDFIYIALGLNVLIILIVKREWLLEKQTFFRLMFGNVLLFLLAYLLPHFNIVYSIIVVSLKVPLISQVLFVPLVKVFRKIKHTPVEIFWTMDRPLMKDGWFILSFCIIGIIIPAVLAFKRLI